jgi:hypothetical protein
VRTSLWTILSVLSVAIGSLNAHADTSGLCTAGCATLRTAPDASLHGPIFQATPGGYEFSSSFPTDWSSMNQHGSEDRNGNHTKGGITYDSGTTLPAGVLPEVERTGVVECTPAPPPVPAPTPEASSGILALSGIALVFAMRKLTYRQPSKLVSLP